VENRTLSVERLLNEVGHADGETMAGMVRMRETGIARCGLENVQTAALTLAAHCRSAGWAGWDPYDGLNSRLFQALPFFQNKLCRLAFIQFMKRSPVNLRPWLGVNPGRNPKGVALFASALVQLSRFG